MPASVIAAVAANAVAAAVGGGLLGSAIGALASMAVGAIFYGAFGSKPRVAEPTFDAQLRDRLVTVRQPIMPWQVIYGQPRVGGALTFWETTNSNNRLHLIITFACHRVEEITSVYFDGEEVPLDADGYATGRYAGYVRIKEHLGDPADTAQPFPDLVTQSAGKWTTGNHLQRGHAKIWVQLDWNTNLFPNGIPNITALIKGARVYDTRTNATAWSANAALCLADYWTNTRYGYGADSTEEMNDDQLVAAANISDEAVPLDAGGTEARYTTHGSFKLDTRRREIIEQLVTPLGAPARYIGGQLFVHAGEYSAPTITLDEGDLRGPCEVSVLVPEGEAANGVKGVYTSPDNAWQPSDYPPVASSTFMTEDGGERIWKEINLPFTISATAAQRLAKIELLRSRQQLTVQAEFKLTAYRLRPGNFVAFTHSAWGMTAKPFEVMTSSLVFIPDENGFFRLGVDATLRETSADVWDWDASEETAVDPAPNTTMQRIAAPTPTGFTAQQSGPGMVLFRVDVDPLNATHRVEIRYTDSGDTDWNNGLTVCYLYKGTTATTAAVVPGSWTFLARAFNLFEDPSPAVATANLTVTADGFTTIVTREEGPDWTGTKTNFVVHPSGALVPEDQFLAADYDWEVFDSFVPTPYATCTYEAAEFDKGIDGNVRVWADIVSALGPGETTGQASPRHGIDHKLNAGSYDGFEEWTIGTANFRQLKSRLVLDTSVGVAKVSGFRTTLDAQARVESGTYTTPGGGSVAVTFAAPFHLVPLILVTPQGSGNVSASVAAASETGFTGYFKSGGSAAAGTANYTANGV